MKNEMICICCPLGCRILAELLPDGGIEVSGNGCPRGKGYAVDEITAPKRTVTSVVRVKGRDKMLSVKTDKPIPKQMIFDALARLKQCAVLPPVKIGDIILENAAGSGAAFVATKNID